MKPPYRLEVQEWCVTYHTPWLDAKRHRPTLVPLEEQHGDKILERNEYLSSDFERAFPHQWWGMITSSLMMRMITSLHSYHWYSKGGKWIPQKVWAILKCPAPRGLPPCMRTSWHWEALSWTSRAGIGEGVTKRWNAHVLSGYLKNPKMYPVRTPAPQRASAGKEKDEQLQASRRTAVPFS